MFDSVRTIWLNANKTHGAPSIGIIIWFGQHIHWIMHTSHALCCVVVELPSLMYLHPRIVSLTLGQSSISCMVKDSVLIDFYIHKGISRLTNWFRRCKSVVWKESNHNEPGHHCVSYSLVPLYYRAITWNKADIVSIAHWTNIKWRCEKKNAYLYSHRNGFCIIKSLKPGDAYVSFRLDELNCGTFMGQF